MKIDYESLIKLAFEARERAVAPFSSFKVGAALLCDSGEVYTGCNVESCSFSATICAERVALFKAISEGEEDFAALVIVGGPDECEDFSYCPPCGVCRQVISEYCVSPDFEIILARSADDYQIYNIEQLLPLAFDGKIL